MNGHASVGHPVNVATGTVFAVRLDIAIPGRSRLTWERRYDSGLIDSEPTPLGSGWTTRYFATLSRVAGGFRFATPEGGVELFADPDDGVDRGEVLRNLGTFQELYRREQRYIVTRWSTDSPDVERYVFRAGDPEVPWLLESIEDPARQGLDMLRDASGRLIGIQQRLEKGRLLIDYTAHDRIKSVAFLLPSGQRQVLASYEYDRAGRLTAAYDALMRADRYEYDDASRITREVVKDGGVFQFQYDERGRCVRTSGLDHYDEKILRYFDLIRWTEVSNSLGYVTRYQHLPTGQVTTQINPLGATWRTAYDEHGRITARTDPYGRVSRCQYDDRGNRTTLINALGQATETAFNDAHQPVRITSPLGSTWQREYDPMNRLVGTTDPAGNHWSLSYDEGGNVVRVVTPNGDALHQTYDDRGRLKEVVDWSGQQKQFTRDPYGRLIREIDPLGGVTALEYDVLGNPLRIVYPDNSEIRCEYDDGDNLTRVVDRKGHSQSYRFGPCGRLLEKTDRLGHTTTFRWSTEPGQIVRLTNPRGEHYLFERDAAGQIVAEVGFDGRRLAFEHDLLGNRVAYVTGSNERIAYKRDELGRLIETTPPDGAAASFTYDEDGYLSSGTNPYSTVRFERDPSGRIVKEHQGGDVIEHEYDILGSRTVTRTSLGHETRYAFDANRLLARVVLNGKDTFEFHRNARGEEIQRILPGGIQMDLQLNALGQVTEMQVASSEPQSRPLRRRSFAYEQSDVMAISDDTWGTTTFVYDASEYLRRFKAEGESETRLSYDETGNVTSLARNGTEEDFVYERGDRLVSRGNVEYRYDAHGRLLFRHDRTAAADGWRFAWNSLGQLCSVTNPDQQVWTYDYDAFGRRVRKSGPDRDVRFVWDRDALIHETVASSSGSSQTSTWVFNPHNLTPLAKVDGTRVLATIVDPVGAARELIDTSSREIVWSARYGPLGSLEGGTRAIDCPIRFQGQYHDEESGLYYNRFRYYDPATGRFVSQDPVRLAGGDNLYAAAPNVWNWIDPFGLASNALFRGDDNYRGGPVGVPLGSDADIKDPKAHVERESKGESSIYTSFSEEHGNPEKKTGALKFTEDNNVYKVKRDDLQKLEAEGKIRIITHENVGEEMDRIGGFSEKDKKNVAGNMKRNKEVLVAGEIPEEMVSKCKK